MSSLRTGSRCKRQRATDHPTQRTAVPVQFLPCNAEMLVFVSSLRGFAEGAAPCTLPAACGAESLLPGLATFCYLDMHSNAAEGACQISVASRDIGNVRKALVSPPSSSGVSRCAKHGPFCCSCESLRALGCALFRVSEEFFDCVQEELLLCSDANPLRESDLSYVHAAVHVSAAGVVSFYSSALSALLMTQNRFLGPWIDLKRFDTPTTVAAALTEGWSSARRQLSAPAWRSPMCALCRTALLTTAAVASCCDFCGDHFCAKCSRSCPSCRFTSCCVKCSIFEVVDRIAVSLCPSCIDA